jgi:hypothetical protein
VSQLCDLSSYCNSSVRLSSCECYCKAVKAEGLGSAERRIEWEKTSPHPSQLCMSHTAFAVMVMGAYLCVDAYLD